MRILLYAGKGGSGRTAIAAATALRCAALGYRTLLTTVDDTRSLADTLMISAGPEPAPVGERLWIQIPDPRRHFRRRWPALDEWLGEIASGGIDDAAEPVGVTTVPGAAELTSLLSLGEQAESDAYDVVIADCPPPATLIRLLAMLDMLPAWTGRVTALDGVAARVARPLLRRFTDFPAPDEVVTASARDLLAWLGRARDLLADGAVSSFRLVTTAGRLSATEARALHAALALYGCAVDAVIANRVTAQPPGAESAAGGNPHSGVELVRETISSLPLLPVPALAEEPLGLDALGRLGVAAYGEADPAGLMSAVPRWSLTVEADRHVLALPLPSLDPRSVTLTQTGERLTIGAGAIRRTVRLPAALAGLVCTDARYDGTVLRLPFRRTSPDGAT